MINLLDDPIFQYNSTSTCTLPELFQKICEDNEDITFEDVMNHHEHLWEMFVVQTMVSVINNSNASFDEACEWSASTWKKQMLNPNLYPDDVSDPLSAWNLMKDESTDLAFLQPRIADKFEKQSTLSKMVIPESSLQHREKEVYTRSIHQNPSFYVYTLIECQTGSQWGGRGWYNASRMNGSTGYRIMFTNRPMNKNGLKNDVKNIIHNLDSIDNDLSDTYDRSATPFVWTAQWKGKEDSFSYHPLYIDCARKVMLKSDDTVWAASGTRRLKSIKNGMTGDPWAIVDMDLKNAKVEAPHWIHFDDIVDYLFNPRYQKGIAWDSSLKKGYVHCRFTNGLKKGGKDQTCDIRFPYETDSDDIFSETSDLKKLFDKYVDLYVTVIKTAKRIHDEKFTAENDNKNRVSFNRSLWRRTLDSIIYQHGLTNNYETVKEKMKNVLMELLIESPQNMKSTEMQRLSTRRKCIFIMNNSLS